MMVMIEITCSYKKKRVKSSARDSISHSVGPSARRLVADSSEHAIFGDRPCFLDASVASLEEAVSVLLYVRPSVTSN